MNWAMLPSRAQLERFNRQNLARQGGLTGRKLRGLSNSMMFKNPYARQVLARMEKLTVILIACDPVSRFEKAFYTKHQCRANDTGRSSSAKDGPCHDSIATVLDNPTL